MTGVMGNKKPGSWLNLVPKCGEKGIPTDVLIDITLSTKKEICCRCETPFMETKLDSDCEVCATWARSKLVADPLSQELIKKAIA